MAFLGSLKKEVETLPPSSFALAMSTGIVSIGCHLLHFEKIADLLFAINKILYVILLLLLIMRRVMFFPKVLKDISTHSTGAGFLTIVAASCLIGLQFMLFEQD